jgi:uncharacterized protein (TIGR03437 family)
LATVAQAAPQLRLSSSTVGPVSIAAAANGATQTVEAYNTGSGSLSLTVASSVPWIAPSVGSARACTVTRAASSCIPINLALNTSSLPAGMATGTVTVSDPNAVDAPQTITVTVAMGGSVPPSLTLYVPPNGTATYPIPTNSATYANSSASWLSLSLNGFGSFTFVYPYIIQVGASPDQPAGTYTGTLALNRSNFAADNKTVNVTMIVTTQPIAQVTSSAVSLRIAPGAPPQLLGLGLTNVGQGTLTAGTPVITTSSCGNSWLTNGAGGLTVDPTGLSPGTCSASVALPSNAINGTQTVPVTLTVVPKGAPQISFQGVLDNATFTPGDNVDPGDILAVKGDQLSFAAPVINSTSPVPTQLSDTSVLVNGTAVPLYYTSYGQINFQMPVNVPAGQALVQVKRTDGTVSNTVSVNVVPRAPRILQLFGGPWGAIVNADSCAGASPCVLGGSLPFPTSFAQPGYPAYPAKAGDTLVIYAIGLGPTSPSVGTGQVAPSSPLAQLTAVPTVTFGDEIFPIVATPSFYGLAPGYAGLYQVNVQIPPNAPKGSSVSVAVGFPDGTISNDVKIAIR